MEKELLSVNGLTNNSSTVGPQDNGTSCCPTGTLSVPYPPPSPCSFLTTAAAIFRNVTYVHGCQL